jgi:hypothetical protein
MKAGVTMFKQEALSFAKLIAGIGEIYQKEFSTAAIEAYWRILEPFRLEDVQAAIYCHMKHPDSGKFLPKPADIIMAIEGGSQDQALSAWSKTFYGIKVVGSYTSVAFDDSLIHAVVRDMNNWIKLCNTEDKQLPFVEKEFLDRYRRYVTKKPLSYPKYLPGRFELQNSAYGYPCSSPVLIGNVLKAKEVIATGENRPFLEISTEKTEKIDLKNPARVCLDRNKEIVKQ